MSCFFELPPLACLILCHISLFLCLLLRLDSRYAAPADIGAITEIALAALSNFDITLRPATPSNDITMLLAPTRGLNTLIQRSHPVF